MNNITDSSNYLDSDRINNAKNRRIAEREGRRNRRREKRMDSAESAHYEGMSSDDEMLTSDSLRFEAEKGMCYIYFSVTSCCRGASMRYH